MIFKPYPKQEEFINAVFSKKYNKCFYGGGVGASKTFAMFFCAGLMCRIYPGYKWAVVRETHQQLRDNTLPSFWKVFPKHTLNEYNDQSKLAVFHNGSQIQFFSENYNSDKELVWIDGLEVNGVILEEMQGIQKRTFDKFPTRLGRNLMEKEYPNIMLGTFNPSQNFTKELIYDRFINGTLPEDWYYLPATVEDNLTPGVDAYKKSLKDSLPPDMYRRYVMGDWNVIENERPFIYAFRYDKHVEIGIERHLPSEVVLSFDFNVDPITCCVNQFYDNKIRTIKEYRLLNSDIYEMCTRIKNDYPDAYFLVTGDASGKNRSALTRGNINYYNIIKNELRLGEHQFKLLAANPSHANRRALTNALLTHFDVKIDASCKHLINDLLLVQVNNDGGIESSKDSHMGHLLDAWTYYLFNFHNKLLKYRI